MEFDLTTVSLLGVPVPVWQRADEEANDLLREFTLIAFEERPSGLNVPDRLLELVDELRATYGAVGTEQANRLSQAVNAGEEEIERLDYHVPTGIEPDLDRLAAALDEADEYCRGGEHLLSLASSPASKAFRDWFLDEFRRQLAGKEPISWSHSTAAATLRETADR